MYSIDYTHQFKKDLRKCAKRGLDIDAIKQAITNDETRRLIIERLSLLSGRGSLIVLSHLEIINNHMRHILAILSVYINKDTTT